MSIFLNIFSQFEIYDKDKKYKYRINLCKRNAVDKVAIEQLDIGAGKPYVVGWFNGSHVFGGSK